MTVVAALLVLAGVHLQVTAVALVSVKAVARAAHHGVEVHPGGPALAWLFVGGLALVALGVALLRCA